MKFSISNIALPQFSHAEELVKLSALGFSGLEVAPSRVWENTWEGLTKSAIDAYRKDAENAGLQIVGLHSLLFDHPLLGLFGDAQVRAKTLEFMIHLSRVCRDLGGRTLIYGGGRRRGDVAEGDAQDIALQFIADYVEQTAEHGTCLCFEPLGPKDSDFINSVHDSIKLVNIINHRAFRVQLDAKALIENGEANEHTFDISAANLVHFHANEPGLGILGQNGAVDHQFMGRQLKRIGYQGFVSIEQRMASANDPLKDIMESIRFAKENYPSTGDEKQKAKKNRFPNLGLPH